MIETIVIGLVVSAACIVLGHLAERVWPARDGSGARPLFNLALFAPSTALRAATAPLFGVLTTVGVNAIGGGVLVLPSKGLGLIAGAVIYLLVMDGLEYLFHRAQHQIPALWAMHSLHHSDPAFNVSTAVRHFWAEIFIKSATIYLLVGLIFKVDIRIIEIYGALSYYNYVTHMNVKLGFGRWSWVLNSPQYHRLHHSRRIDDEDCNFAALLPVFDVLSGVYRRPAAGDYAPTGLRDGQAPSSLFQGLTWPLHIASGDPLKD